MIKKIKCQNLFSIIPNSDTIQNCLNLLIPNIFSNKQEAKYFLTIIGDCILKKNENLIESAINLIGRIHDTYPPEVAGDLERRFLNSIRAGSPRKYSIGMQKVMESKK